MNIKIGKLIYHQTSIKNLQSIIENGLLSREQLQTLGFNFKDIADHEILAGRAEMNLYKYVPFHFHPYTAFDYKIRADHPNENFIYLCMYRNHAETLNASILTAHPLSTTPRPQLLPYPDGFSNIDWDTMEITSGNPGYNTQVRMAECLIENCVSINEMACIYVKNTEDYNHVYNMLNTYNIKGINVYERNYYFNLPSGNSDISVF